MNTGIKEAPAKAAVSDVVADQRLVDALQKYASAQRELGREDNVLWALETIRGLDLYADKRARMKAQAADVEVRAALQTYRVTAEAQGRKEHVSVANQALQSLDRNSFPTIYAVINDLEQKLNGKIDAVAASIPKKK
jgi:hypothetical protein